jgi:DNA-binding NarL/FixJ family response regulator
MRRGTQLPKSGASVLIADDHPLFLLGLRTFLEQAESYRVVAAAGSADEVLHHAAKTNPDIVIVDLSILRSSGFKLIQQLRELCPGVKVLILTGYATLENLVNGIRAGAMGFLSKESDPSLLLLALDAVQQGKPWIQREFMEGLLHALKQPNPGWRQLSQRELQVLQLVAQGLSNKEIAYRLHIRPGTVKEHITRILRKLNLRNRTEATLYALRLFNPDGSIALPQDPLTTRPH